MPNLSGQFLGTIGMEYESIFLDTRSVNQLLLGRILDRFGRADLLSITRDASTESYAEYFRTGGSKNLPIYKHTKSLKRFSQYNNVEDYQKGFELIINPIEVQKLEPLLFTIFEVLTNAGDYTSERASVHFHVGFGNNLRIMKNLLKICLHLDPVLYRLGGMGGIFRGHSNNAAYARPLLNSCVVPISNSLGRRRNRIPAVERDSNVALRWRNSSAEDTTSIGNTPSTFSSVEFSEQLISDMSQTDEVRFARIINPEKALFTNTVSDFWECFGVTPEINGLPKYHPSRYSGCNFYAIPAHGTFEFRHFNQSMDYRLLTAISKFLRCTVELSTVIGKSEIERFQPQECNSEISIEDSANSVEMLMSFFQEKELDDIPSANDIEMILGTIEESSFSKLSKIPVRTHIRDFSIPSEVVERAELEIVGKSSKPEQIDIHNISNYPLV